MAVFSKLGCASVSRFLPDSATLMPYEPEDNLTVQSGLIRFKRCSPTLPASYGGVHSGPLRPAAGVPAIFGHADIRLHFRSRNVFTFTLKILHSFLTVFMLCDLVNESCLELKKTKQKVLARTTVPLSIPTKAPGRALSPNEGRRAWRRGA